MCNQDLEAYKAGPWHKPKLGTAVVAHVSAPAHGVEAALHFRSSDAGSEGFTIWLDPEEEFQFDFELTLGTQDPDPKMGYASLLLDGLVQPMDAGTGEQPALVFDLHPGNVVRRSVVITAGAIATGAHSGALLFWNGSGASLVTYALTILKGSSTFVSRPAPLSDQIQRITDVPQGEGSNIVPSNANFLLTDHPEPDGSLILGFLVTPTWSGDCLPLLHRLVLVAFLDNLQVPLGDLGLRPSLELRQTKAAVFSMTVQDLPVSSSASQPHVFQIWQLEGDGAYSDAPPGTPSLWSEGGLHQIGRMVW
jgi:hypothetical protein